MRRENKQQGGGVLPPGYTQLEYIESTGTQWIEIPNYYPSTSSTVSGRFKKSTDLTSIFQAGKDSNRIMLLPVNSTRIDYCYGSGYKTLNVQPGDCNVGMWYDFEMDYQHLKINGNTYNIQGAANTIPYICLHLFSFDFGGEVNVKPNALAELVVQDPLSHDIHLIPALRGQDSKPGLYDIVNNTFYANAGTGEFLYA